MLAVELCGGAGGLARGLIAAGIEIAIAVEENKYAASTYRFNFPKVDVIEDDIRKVSGSDILKKLDMGKGKLDLLVAGLPCQGFSESNRRTRTRGNPRNQLYREVLRLLSEVNPRWFVIENVAGIETLDSGRFSKTDDQGVQCRRLPHERQRIERRGFWGATVSPAGIHCRNPHCQGVHVSRR